MWDLELYKKAIRFAAEAHREQKIPGSEMSYVAHLSDVCQEVLAAIVQAGEGDVNLAMSCALLHDTIEDTEVGFKEVRDQFGERVARGVKALSKNEALPKERQMMDSLDRILEQEPEVRIVKMADRISNLQRPPLHWTKEKCIKYQAEARMILSQLKGVNSFIEARLAQKTEAYSNFIEEKE